MGSLAFSLEVETLDVKSGVEAGMCHLAVVLFVTYLHLKMLALVFQVVSVEDVCTCTCISFSCQLCIFVQFLLLKTVGSEAVQQ